MSKYGNIRTTVDNIVFDSQKEANRYCELKLLEKADVIFNLELQPKFVLQPGYEKNGKKVRAITYKADFSYWDHSMKKWIAEDVKGCRTQVFDLKAKMFEYKYPDIELRII